MSLIFDWDDPVVIGTIVDWESGASSVTTPFVAYEPYLNVELGNSVINLPVPGNTLAVNLPPQVITVLLPRSRD